MFVICMSHILYALQGVGWGNMFILGQETDPASNPLTLCKKKYALRNAFLGYVQMRTCTKCVSRKIKN